MDAEIDPKVILGLLEKKGRAGAPELGTVMSVMVQLEKKELIRRDGKIHTGKRGKPPIAWVIADGKTPEEVAEINEPLEKPSETAKKKTSKNGELYQARIDRALEEVKVGPYASECNCVVTWQSIPAAQLMRYPGCKENYICGALDAVRRKVLKNV